jgi:hypothetical protein
MYCQNQERLLVSNRTPSAQMTARDPMKTVAIASSSGQGADALRSHSRLGHGPAVCGAVSIAGGYSDDPAANREDLRRACARDGDCSRHFPATWCRTACSSRHCRRDHARLGGVARAGNGRLPGLLARGASRSRRVGARRCVASPERAQAAARSLPRTRFRARLDRSPPRSRRARGVRRRLPLPDRGKRASPRNVSRVGVPAGGCAAVRVRRARRRRDSSCVASLCDGPPSSSASSWRSGVCARPGARGSPR